VAKVASLSRRKPGLAVKVVQLAALAALAALAVLARVAAELAQARNDGHERWPASGHPRERRAADGSMLSLAARFFGRSRCR
jgi:hypothetical protein